MRTPGSDGWQVVLDPPDDVAYAALARDRVWNCFAIADLLPPFRAYSSYAVAAAGDASPSAACLLLRHPAFTMLIPSGDAAGVAALLAELPLPERTEVQAQAAHLPALERHYCWQSDRRAMLRMGVTPAAFRPPADDEAGAVPPIVRLGPADLPALQALYRHYPESVFRADHLGGGVFYGVRAGDHVVAAGGTHVVAETHGLGVLGSIFTLPAYRRRGYGRAVTAAIVAELFGRGCRDAMLTVGATNAAANHLYESLGFTSHCTYASGVMVRGADGPTTEGECR